MPTRTIIRTQGGVQKNLTVNRDREAGVKTLSRSGRDALTVNRTAPVINSDPAGASRPLLSKLVGNAAAAYSLRDLNDKAGNNKVVKVRREADNEERDFLAKEVTQIADWTNGLQETTLPADLGITSFKVDSLAYGLASYGISLAGGASLDDFDGTFTPNSNGTVWSNGSPLGVNYALDGSGSWVLSFDDGTNYGYITTYSTTKYPFQVTDWGSASVSTNVSDLDNQWSNVVASNYLNFTPIYGATTTYPTAEAAYSLRKVRSTYTGHAVRIRRASDNVEVNVGFDTNDEVSDSSAITNVVESPDQDDTTATTLGAFLNEEVTGYSSDFSTTNGWQGSNTLVSANVDANADGAGVPPSDDFLKMVANPRLSIRDNSVVDNFVIGAGGGVVNVTFDYYAPQDISTFKVIVFSSSGNPQFGDNNQIVAGSGSFSATVTLTDAQAQTLSDFRVGSTTDQTGKTLYIKNLQIKRSNHNAHAHTWYDQSGNGKDATQDIAGEQPKIASTGALLSDGILFDGDDDGLNMPTDLISSINSASAFVVAKAVETDSARVALALSRNDPDFRYYLPAIVSSNFNFGYGTSATAVSLGAADTGEHLFSATAGSSTAEAFLDGVSKGTVSSLDGKSALTADGIGGINTSTFWSGNIKEIIIYASDQSSNRFKIESNINNHYGLLDGTSLSSSTAFFLDGTAGSPSSFTADGLDGFTMIMGGAGNVRAGIELQNKVPSGKHVVVSFDADLTLGTGTATPIIKLMKTSLSGGGGGNNFNVIQGRNTISLNSNNDDSKFVLFLEGNTNVGYSISNFTISLRDENGFVNTWYDQSGNSNNATQSQSTKQPLIVGSGIIKTQGGKPCLDFDGIDDILAFYSPDVQSGNIRSVFFAGSSPTNNYGNVLGTPEEYVIRKDSNRAVSLSNIGSSRLDSAFSFSGTATHLVTVIRNYSVPSSSLSLDGDVDATRTDSYGLHGSHVIGGKQSGSNIVGEANFNCLEVVVYASDQTANRTAIEANINNQYLIY